MAEQDLQQPQASFDETAGAGARLRHAREAQRLSRTDIAARTKIAERHLAAIEEERFSDLASSTYAVGFSRAYARAVGLDEREIAQTVRSELDMVDEAEAAPKPTFEPGDPARVPSSRAAWLAGGGALAVLALVVTFWGSYIFPAASLPDLTSDAPSPAAPAPPVASAPPGAAAAAQEPIVLTATQDGVWIKVTDETGQQLFQKELAQGESYTVPADAAGPQLRTARPDALGITVGGREVPALAQKSSTITVPLSGAALLARGGVAAPPTQVQGQAAQIPQPPAAPAQPPVQAAQAPVARPSPASSMPATRSSPTATMASRPASAAETPRATPSPARPSEAARASASAVTGAPRAAIQTPAASPAPTSSPPPAASAEAGASAPASARAAPVEEPAASPVSP